MMGRHTLVAALFGALLVLGFLLLLQQASVLALGFPTVVLGGLVGACLGIGAVALARRRARRGLRPSPGRGGAA